MDGCVIGGELDRRGRGVPAMRAHGCAAELPIVAWAARPRRRAPATTPSPTPFNAFMYRKNEAYAGRVSHNWTAEAFRAGRTPEKALWALYGAGS